MEHLWKSMICSFSLTRAVGLVADIEMKKSESPPRWMGAKNSSTIPIPSHDMIACGIVIFRWCTPWKMNLWNLKPSRVEEKENHLNHPAPLLFGGSTCEFSEGVRWLVILSWFVTPIAKIQALRHFFPSYMQSGPSMAVLPIPSCGLTTPTPSLLGIRTREHMVCLTSYLEDYPS